MQIAKWVWLIIPKSGPAKTLPAGVLPTALFTVTDSVLLPTKKLLSLHKNITIISKIIHHSSMEQDSPNHPAAAHKMPRSRLMRTRPEPVRLLLVIPYQSPALEIYLLVTVQ